MSPMWTSCAVDLVLCPHWLPDSNGCQTFSYYTGALSYWNLQACWCRYWKWYLLPCCRFTFLWKTDSNFIRKPIHQRFLTSLSEMISYPTSIHSSLLRFSNKYFFAFVYFYKNPFPLVKRYKCLALTLKRQWEFSFGKYTENLKYLAQEIGFPLWDFVYIALKG
jgi:hypothetical protein